MSERERLMVEALRRFARYFGGDLYVEYPTGSGVQQTLDEVAASRQTGWTGLVADLIITNGKDQPR